MKFTKLKTKISDLLIFDKELLRSYEPREEALNQNLKYWTKKGTIIPLKKGRYLLKERYEKEENKDLYLEYIANKLIKPSYVSAEYVLSKFQLLTEPVQALTSVTVKVSREIENSLASFNYYSIRKELFRGYQTKYFYDAPVLIAEKPKALFDFLYFRFLQEIEPNIKNIKALRIKWEDIDEDWFFSAKKYAQELSNPRLIKTFMIIESNYYA
jgi:predicted transcriptional regulator of viral defense system